jgi:hypothetical protein
MFKTVSPNKPKLIEQLTELTKLQGEFFMDDDVRIAVDAWYNRFDKIEAPGLKDETGFVSRVLDFVIKGAMLISSARRGDKHLTIDDIHESTEVILPLIVPTGKVVNSVKKDDRSMTKKRGLVLAYLAMAKEHKAERSVLLRAMSLQLDHEDLDRIVQFMIEQRTLTIDNHGGVIVYRLRTDRPEIAKYVQEV